MDLDAGSRTGMQFAVAAYPDGSTLLAEVEPAQLHDYTSDRTGKAYPTRLVATIPSLDAEREVVAHIPSQEIVGEITGAKYEGAGKVRGTLRDEPTTGTSVVELVGNW